MIRRHLIPVLVIFIVGIFCSKAYFHAPFLPLFHDQVQGERVYQIAKSLAYGQFPVRFVPDLGYGFGYPLFNFYAPLPYYIGSIFYLFGFDLILATKLMIVIPFILAGVLMYSTLIRIWGILPALFSALLYLTAPYHGVQYLVRGSVGELYVYAVLPLIFYGWFRLLSNQITKNVQLITSAAITVILLSHNVSIIMFSYLSVLFVIIYLICVIKYKKGRLFQALRNLLIIYLIPLLISAFFLIPAFSEIKYTQLSISSGNNVDFRQHYKSISQLWSSPWGFGGSSQVIEKEGMSYMIGKISLILSLMGILIIIYQWISSKTFTMQVGFSMFTFAYLLISVFFITNASYWLWTILPYFPLIQFPWRFIMISSYCASAASGYVFYILNKRLGLFAIPLLTVILIYQLFNYKTFPSTKYFESNGYYQFNSRQLTNINHLRFDASKISDEYLPKGTFKADRISEISYDGVSCYSPCRVLNQDFTPGNYSMQITVDRNSTVFIQKSYFPDFNVYVDGSKNDLIKGPQNSLGVRLLPGTHQVVFHFKDTPIRTIANGISLIAIITILMYYVKKGLKNMKVNI